MFAVLAVLENEYRHVDGHQLVVLREAVTEALYRSGIRTYDDMEGRLNAHRNGITLQNVPIRMASGLVVLHELRVFLHMGYQVLFVMNHNMKTAATFCWMRGCSIEPHPGIPLTCAHHGAQISAAHQGNVVYERVMGYDGRVMMPTLFSELRDAHNHAYANFPPTSDFDRECFNLKCLEACAIVAKNNPLNFSVHRSTLLSKRFEFAQEIVKRGTMTVGPAKLWFDVARNVFQSVIDLPGEQWTDLCNHEDGCFAPIDGSMGGKCQHHSVLADWMASVREEICRLAAVSCWDMMNGERFEVVAAALLARPGGKIDLDKYTSIQRNGNGPVRVVHKHRSYDFCMNFAAGCPGLYRLGVCTKCNRSEIEYKVALTYAFDVGKYAVVYSLHHVGAHGTHSYVKEQCRLALYGRSIILYEILTKERHEAMLMKAALMTLVLIEGELLNTRPNIANDSACLDPLVWGKVIGLLAESGHAIMWENTGPPACPFTQIEFFREEPPLDYLTWPTIYEIKNVCLMELYIGLNERSSVAQRNNVIAPCHLRPKDATSAKPLIENSVRTSTQYAVINRTVCILKERSDQFTPFSMETLQLNAYTLAMFMEKSRDLRIMNQKISTTTFPVNFLTLLQLTTQSLFGKRPSIVPSGNAATRSLLTSPQHLEFCHQLPINRDMREVRMGVSQMSQSQPVIGDLPQYDN